jgi:tyrosine-protein phosphatase YwqE
LSNKGYIDIHNHLFPPVDDGPEEIEETLLSLEKFVEYGFEKIIFTPHINPSFQEERKNSLSLSVENFQSEIEKIPVKFYLSCEYLLEPGIFRIIEKGEIITLTPDSRFFLVEMWVPFVDQALKIFMEKCLSKNYFPVIAHPERNQPLERIKKMKEFGYKIQVNIGSVFGLYGDEVRRNALTLLKEGLADCIGTDAHDYGFSKELKNYMEKLMGEIGEKEFRRLFINGPAEIME